MIGSNLATYSGIVLLVFASGWSLIPRRIGALPRLINMHVLW
jgi:hypothetical protein